MFSAGKNALAVRSANHLVLWVTMLVSCLALFSASRSIAQDVKAGWVLDMNGQWAVSGGSTLLAQAASVPAGGQLVNLAPKDGDYIRIADLHGDLLRSLRCTKNGCGQCVKDEVNCAAPIEPLPKAPAQPGLIAATWEGVMDLFGGQPERYSIHRSRSIGADTCIADKVVPLEASGSVHLDAVLKSCEPGVYQLEFIAAGAAAPHRAMQRTNQVTVNWAPNESAGRPSVALAPGLYEVRFTRDWRSGSAWILVCASQVFEDDRASFEKISTEIAGWGERVSRESKQEFKRATLDYLSRSKGGPDQVR